MSAQDYNYFTSTCNRRIHCNQMHFSKDSKSLHPWDEFQQAYSGLPLITTTDKKKMMQKCNKTVVSSISLGDSGSLVFCFCYSWKQKTRKEESVWNTVRPGLAVTFSFPLILTRKPDYCQRLFYSSHNPWTSHSSS